MNPSEMTVKSPNARERFKTQNKDGDVYKPKENGMKIDTTKIPEFDSLPEAARNAILGMEFADAPDMSKYVEKSVLDKKASEAAELSRKLKEQMSAEDREKAERDAELAEMKAKLTQLEREKAESIYKASYLSLGYSDELAAEAAKAMADGNTEKVFEIQQKAFAAQKQQIENELKKQVPHPTGTGKEAGGGESAGVELAKMLGKRKREAQNASNDALKHYMR